MAKSQKKLLAELENIIAEIKANPPKYYEHTGRACGYKCVTHNKRTRPPCGMYNPAGNSDSACIFKSMHKGKHSWDH